MSESKPTGLLNTPITNKNYVAQRIVEVAQAKKTGKFTFQVGRADRVINLAMGLATVCAMGQVGVGVHKMANGYGRKEGF